MGSGEDQGTKEFEPSQSKLNNLRRQGNVPKSPELNQLLSFIVAIIFLLAGGGYIWGNLQEMFIGLLSATKERSIEDIGAGYIIGHSALVFAKIIFPMLFLVGFSGIMGDVWQVGLMFSTGQLGFKLNKLNPVNYFKQTFSMKKVVEFLKQLGKVIVLGGVAYCMVRKHLLKLIELVNTDSIIVVANVLKEVIQDFTLYATVALFIITLIDASYQKHKFIQDNKMTRKEMTDEFKKNEGDPQMKQQRRAMARKFTQGSLVELVKDSDFITTNPTKIAVAVKYESGKMEAPLVQAKGSDSMAWRIIQLANEHEVPVIENIPLARALYKLAQLGGYIPEELYNAVAEVLLFSYQVRAKSKARQ